jgi:2,3-bisphosphoglycerate-dependent phosphoglycerate mutase
VELVLVRHAEPEWVLEGLSVDDPPLTKRGQRQAECLAERLGGESFDDVFVSPLVRARQTAGPVLAALDRKEEIDPWLEEIRSPVWHGTPAEKAEESFREERSRPVDRRWEGLIGGESVRDFVARIRQSGGLFLEERGVVPVRDDPPVWRITQTGKRILLIAHAGVNSVVICHLLGLTPTPWEWDRFVLGHASITRLEALPLAEGHTWSLTRLSDVEHLAREDRTR